MFDSNLHNFLSRIFCAVAFLTAFGFKLLYLSGLGLRDSQCSSHPTLLNFGICLLELLCPCQEKIVPLQSLHPVYSLLTNLQASLDGQLFSQLSNTSNIHDQAHLCAISHSSGTSRGWPKAIPQPSFDVVIVLRSWLDVPLFPCYHFVRAWWPPPRVFTWLNANPM